MYYMFVFGDWMLESWRRIFTISKKPDWKEYRAMLKVISAGILVVAFIGFAVILFFTVTKIGSAQ